MTVGELQNRLSAFPPHFEVELWWDGMGESDDETAEVSGVHNFQPSKLVSIETATRMLSDGKGLKKRPFIGGKSKPRAKPCQCFYVEGGSPCGDNAAYKVVSLDTEPFYLCLRHMNKFTDPQWFEVFTLTYNPLSHESKAK